MYKYGYKFSFYQPSGAAPMSRKAVTSIFGFIALTRLCS